MKRTILRQPDVRPPGRRTHLRNMIAGGASFFPYLVSAKLAGCPGTSFRAPIARMGLRALMTNGYRSLLDAYRLIVSPMDSVRYFEFEFAKRATAGLEISEYLDVSSPRLLPLILLREHLAARATLLNPDAADLEETRQLARSLGLLSRCRTDNHLIGESEFDADFDLVTSISVVEHIPEDSAAVGVMWRSLRRGGRLVITVPCCREAYEEFTDFNPYGVLTANDEGLVFWQRFYSPDCLKNRIFSVTGAPKEMKVFGEIMSGSYDRNVESKKSNPLYPTWREPWYMAQEWKYFPDIESMPGIGVVGMMFVKES